MCVYHLTVSRAFFFLFLFFFFFQAEDGIRDGRVTGVQTCALPICGGRLAGRGGEGGGGEPGARDVAAARGELGAVGAGRSEERRVGKEWRSRGGADQ